MESKKINDKNLGNLLDGLAIVYSLPIEDDDYESGMYNLRQVATNTGVSLDFEIEETDYGSEKERVIEELKEKISEEVESYHFAKNSHFRHAVYLIEYDCYHYVDGEYYRQEFTVDVDENNDFWLIDAKFDLRGTYIESFKEKLPIKLN